MWRIVNLKKDIFRISEIVLDEVRPLRKVYCKRLDLLLSDKVPGEGIFRFDLRDSRLDQSKTYEVELLVRKLNALIWITVDNRGVIESLADTLRASGTDNSINRFSIELCLKHKHVVKVYEVGLFFNDKALVLITK